MKEIYVPVFVDHSMPDSPIYPHPPGPANSPVPYRSAHSYLGKQFPGRAELSGSPCTHTHGPAATSRSLPADTPRYYITTSMAIVLSWVYIVQGKQGSLYSLVTFKRKIPWSPAQGPMSMFPDFMFLNMLERKEHGLQTDIISIVIIYLFIFATGWLIPWKWDSI